MQGGALADYDWIRDRAAELKAALEGGRELRIATAAGTDFTALIPKPGDDGPGFNGPFVRVEDGWATGPGDEAAFPDGEVFFAPAEFSASGRLMVDGPIEYAGLAESPVEVIIERGSDNSSQGRLSTGAQAPAAARRPGGRRHNRRGGHRRQPGLPQGRHGPGGEKGPGQLPHRLWNRPALSRLLDGQA